MRALEAGRTGLGTDGGVGSLTESAAAFLKRRLHHQRMRMAALRALKSASSLPGDRVDLQFDADSGLLDRTAAWLTDAGTGAVPSGGPPPTHYLAPRLNLVIMIVGSRGDVQPFIPIGKRLAWRHRVRIATHAEFRPMVERAGLEFYPLAGDPRELMEYMIKTGGHIVPTHLQQIVEDVPRKRQIIAEILESTWRACTEKDPDRPEAKPFVADGIIANPPSYGHFHCAEALRVPLHIVFTMPWTPTSAFPHPLTHLSPGTHHPVRNWFSYGVMDLLMWAGVADLINRFRQQTLGLRPIELNDGAATLLSDNEVPFTYLFPASVIPKPADWGSHIDLANFIFFDQADTYTPPPDLLEFLGAGERPIYVGFGSCVVQDPAATSRTIFAALEKAGARGIVSRGWGHLGGDAPPPHVHLIDDCPHDWLFARCRAVCHHGGAGTTAAGLRAGLPTVIVPFFGDQFFWGQVVFDAGAGPRPIPIDILSSDRLAEAFAVCTRPEIRIRAEELGAKIRTEDGIELVFESLRRHLPIGAMQCSGNPEHLATVYCEPCRLRLCQSCYDGRHGSHRSHPYRYVEWGVREPERLTEELRDLIADAAQALHAGRDELRPMAAPERHGIVLGDADGGQDDENVTVS